MCKSRDHTQFLHFLKNAFEISKSERFQTLQLTLLIFRIINLSAIIWSIVIKSSTHEKQYGGNNNSKIKTKIMWSSHA